MIPVVSYVLLGLVVVYSFMLIVFLGALLFLPGIKPLASPVKLSIVVPFRNEGLALEAAIERFRDLHSKIEGLELIFVNDHSADISRAELEKLFTNSTLRIIHAELDVPQGKKYAVLNGVRQATNGWVLTVDIDTFLDPRMLGEFMADPPTGSACVVIPIRPIGGESFQSKLYDLEFMVLQGVGAGSALIKRPLLANGACFFVNRDAYLDSAEHRVDWSISGGDDVFAMFAIARKKGSAAISAHIPRKPLAETLFSSSGSSLFFQRVRWIKKTTHVIDPWYTFIAWFVFGVNLVFVSLWISSLFFDLYPLVWAYSCLKWIGEIALITWGVLYFRRSETLLAAIPGLFIYPFYLCALVFTAASAKPAWKD